MTAREILNDGEKGLSLRNKVNNNFAYLFDPEYIFMYSGVAQTIPNSTWTTIKWPLTGANVTDVTFDANGVMSFPLDVSGVWFGSASVAWDNTLSGLEMHLRKMRFVITTDSGTNAVATSDFMFDPAQGVTGEASKTFQQVYGNLLMYPATGTLSAVAQVWHNATVSGSPVSIDTVPDGIQAPLLMLARLGNE